VTKSKPENENEFELMPCDKKSKPENENEFELMPCDKKSKPENENEKKRLLWCNADSRQHTNTTISNYVHSNR